MLIGADWLYWCSLSSLVLIIFFGTHCLHWCSLLLLVLIAFIIARTNEGKRMKQIFWVPFETAHKWKTHQWKPHEPTWCTNHNHCGKMKVPIAYVLHRVCLKVGMDIFHSTTESVVYKSKVKLPFWTICNSFIMWNMTRYDKGAQSIGSDQYFSTWVLKNIVLSSEYWYWQFLLTWYWYRYWN